jgi:hypothetical protein
MRQSCAPLPAKLELGATTSEAHIQLEAYKLGLFHIVLRKKAMPSCNPTARQTRQQERSRTLSAASKTRSKGNNRTGRILVAGNPMLRTVAGTCRQQCAQLAKASD